MKHKLILLFALGVLLMGQHVNAKTQGPPHFEKTAGAPSLKMHKPGLGMEIHKLMGHISIAYLALDIDLPDDALNHIDQADSLAEQLSRELPSRTVDSTLKYGKVTFSSRNMTKHYYVPVLDDLFLLSEYDTVYRHLQSKDIQQIYAGIVKLDIFVDLRKLGAALKAGTQDLTKKRYQKAQQVLGEIFRGAIVEELVDVDPRTVIYDNLALAKNFIQNGLYLSARLTLVNVKQGIDIWENDSRAARYTEDITRLQREIIRLDSALEKKDPTVMQRIGRQSLSWRKMVKSWF